jgi:hypothetical protein
MSLQVLCFPQNNLRLQVWRGKFLINFDIWRAKTTKKTEFPLHAYLLIWLQLMLRATKCTKKIASGWPNLSKNGWDARNREATHAAQDYYVDGARLCVWWCVLRSDLLRELARRGELRVEVSRADLASFLVEHFHSSLFTQILCGSASSQPGPSNNTPAITAPCFLPCAFAWCIRWRGSTAGGYITSRRNKDLGQWITLSFSTATAMEIENEN